MLSKTDKVCQPMGPRPRYQN